MPGLFIPTCILLLVYIFFLIILTLGWKKIQEYNPNANPTKQFISVIIPFRNEAPNLLNLIGDLKKQTLKHHQYEIILVDDHSEDNSISIIKKQRDSKTQMKLIVLPSELTGKKQALHYGIKSARGNLIVTTDADCRMNTNWLLTISSFYNQYKPKLIIGPVLYLSSKGMFYRFQQIELISIMGSTAGTAGLGMPVMCNGANLAFEKDAYNALIDPTNEALASGDDIFLLQNLKKKYRDAILFLKNKDAIVYTNASDNILNFINQRKRWLSKSSSYTDPEIKLLALIVYLTCLTILSSFFISIMSFKFLLWAFAALMLKTIADGILYISCVRYFQKKLRLHLLVPFQIIYIIYVSLMPAFSLKRSFTWKNRKYRK